MIYFLHKFRVKQNDTNGLWYLQRKQWFGRWVDVLDDYGNKITDASWAGSSCNSGITGKADRWVFENVVDTNWRHHK